MRFINLEHHPQDSRLKIADDDVCQTLNSSMGTGGNNVPLILQIFTTAFRKTAHPMSSEEGQGWEQTEICDTLNAFDNGEMRTPTVIVYEDDNS